MACLTSGEAISLARIDTIVSLLLALALVINAAILILAGTAFYNPSNAVVIGIDDAYHLLDLFADAVAAILFGLALLTSDQSSTLTGTIA